MPPFFPASPICTATPFSAVSPAIPSLPAAAAISGPGGKRCIRAATRIEPDTLAPIAAYLGMELLRGGFTSLVEFHYLQNAIDGTPYAHRPAMAEAIIEGAQQAGIGLTVLFGIYQTGNFDGTLLQGGQRRFDTSPDAALKNGGRCAGSAGR